MKEITIGRLMRYRSRAKMLVSGEVFGKWQRDLAPSLGRRAQLKALRDLMSTTRNEQHRASRRGTRLLWEAFSEFLNRKLTELDK